MFPKIGTSPYQVACVMNGNRMGQCSQMVMIYAPQKVEQVDRNNPSF